VANARAAAQSYAPKPNGSTITYGLIAAALVLVVALIAGAFYRVDVLASLWPIALVTLAAFAAGVALRVRRRSAHELAFSAEYDVRNPAASPQTEDAALATDGASDADVSPPSTFITFRSPFLLPGLDRPHPAGTFEVRERREALDVSFDAAIVTRTIMLSGDGGIEALDVKADDLAAALRLDAGVAG
jgi:hypothetical protein